MEFNVFTDDKPVVRIFTAEQEALARIHGHMNGGYANISS